MNIIPAKVEIIENLPVMQHIELCGRICYKSEDKLAEGTAEKFIAGIIKRGHEAVLEHGNLCFAPNQLYFEAIKSADDALASEAKLRYRSFLRYSASNTRRVISGNVRAWRTFLKAHIDAFGDIPHCTRLMACNYPALFPEMQKYASGGWSGGLPMIAYSTLTPEEQLIHRPLTVKFTVDRGVSHEIVRHRPASFCQESTRYCNYSKDKFGGQITVIKPCYLDENTEAYIHWKNACYNSEDAYFYLLEHGHTAQEARGVLPTSLKTEVIMTATLDEWAHFLYLRCDTAAHPQMREVACPLRDMLIADKRYLPAMLSAKELFPDA